MQVFRHISDALQDSRHRRWTPIDSIYGPSALDSDPLFYAKLAILYEEQEGFDESEQKDQEQVVPYPYKPDRP